MPSPNECSQSKQTFGLAELFFTSFPPQQRQIFANIKGRRVGEAMVEANLKAAPGDGLSR
jgi:hypothetical protein